MKNLFFAHRRRMIYTVASASLVGVILFIWNGCGTVSKQVAAIGVTTGLITKEQGKSIERTGEAFGKAMEEITPEQEYYVGRAVGATIVNQYRVYNNKAATMYLNRVGQSIAAASDRPETFKGYYFLILDTEEINAFAAPGGFVFVSRGMLRLCRNEDELAAVLAHEVAHVQLKHALGAISNKRWTAAATILATEAGKNLGGEELKALTTQFEGSIGDITNTLVTTGYARGQEHAADKIAVALMPRLGYDPQALISVLENMKTKIKLEVGFGKTHPPPDERINDVRNIIGGNSAPVTIPAPRQHRFSKAMSGV